MGAAGTSNGLILPPVAVAVTAVAALAEVKRMRWQSAVAVTTRFTSAKIGYCIELGIAVAVTAIAAGTTICV